MQHTLKEGEKEREQGRKMIIYNVKGVETLKRQGCKQDLSIIRKEVDVNTSTSSKNKKLNKRHKLTRENNQFLKSLGFTLQSKRK